MIADLFTSSAETRSSNVASDWDRWLEKLLKSFRASSGATITPESA